MINEAIGLPEDQRDKAVSLLRVAVSMADSAGEVSDLSAFALERLARMEYYMGNTARATTHALKALDYWKTSGNTPKIIVLKTLIGDILRGNGLFIQSRGYLASALELADSIDDNFLRAVVYNRFAALDMEDTIPPVTNEEKYAKKSLEISRKLRCDSLVYNNLNILGVIESRRGNSVQALHYFDEAYRIVEGEFPMDEPLLLINMARDLIKLGKVRAAEEMNLKALALAQKFNIPQYVRLSCLNLENIYKLAGDYRKAYKYMTLYYQSKEFILTQKVQVQLTEFNNQLASEKQDAESNLLKYNMEIDRNRLHTVVAIAFLLLLLLVVLVILIINQRKHNAFIRQSASKLEQSNKVLRRFISILGHDLRSPFNAILGFTEILKTERDLPEELREKSIDRIYEASKSTYVLLERILEWSKLQSGGVKPQFRSCDLDEMINDTIRLMEPAAFLKNISVKYLSSGQMTIFADCDMILTVIRNLLNNAIKFTCEGGEIRMWTEQHHEKVSFHVSDTGVGINESDIEKLFRLDENYKSAGTAGETGSGLGLILSQEYLQLHKGTISVQSEKGKGSTFTVDLPVGDFRSGN